MKKYYIDEFVNFDAPSSGQCVDMGAQIKQTDDFFLYEEMPSHFSSRFEWDTRNEQAFPVIVWEKEGNPVAFWDCEYCVGYFV